MIPGPQIGKMFVMNLGAEMIYSFVIILCSLLIYFGTKELYELSEHKGIKYFRQAFLFFAFAYFFRSFLKFILSYFNTSIIRNLPVYFGATTLFLFIYFSSIAVIYLLNSIVWKKWGNGLYKNIIFHLLALLVAGICIYFNSTTIYLWMHIGLFAFIIISLISSSEKLRKHRFYIIYILIFIFWILNAIDVLIPKYLQSFQPLIYMFSTGIFLTILYKVTKLVGSN